MFRFNVLRFETEPQIEISKTRFGEIIKIVYFIYPIALLISIN